MRCTLSKLCDKRNFSEMIDWISSKCQFLKPNFFPVVNKRWFICSIILAGEPVSKAKLLCDCRLHNTDLEKKKKTQFAESYIRR